MAPTGLAVDDQRQTAATAGGDQVGVIPGVRGGQASVDPDLDITDRATSSPGWAADAVAFTLDEVGAATDDEGQRPPEL